MKRRISHSEIHAALECWARWDFAYGGHLVGGDALERKQPVLRLREGRAWGRAVAALHTVVDRQAPAPAGDPLLSPPASDGALFGPSTAPDGGRLSVDNHLHRLRSGVKALAASLNEDAASQLQHGVHNVVEHLETETRLVAILEHYHATTEPMDVFGAETELLVPLPSRTGQRASNRFVFHGFLDALTERDGRLWIVEYKLRGRLTDFEQVALGRQYRRYAWAAERVLDREVAGVIVDERLNEAPKPARWVKAKRKGEGIDGMVPSHAKDQLTTPGLYAEACERAGVPFDDGTFAALHARRWQARHPVIFRRSEIREAGEELVSAARLIAQLDSGVLWPVRNPSQQRCGGCQFREICTRVDDALIDLDFERKPPKRLRTEEELLAA